MHSAILTPALQPVAVSPYAKLPGSLWAVFGLGALLGLMTANPWLTAAAILVLPVFMTLLWRQGETPVLLFAVSFQWLQVTAKVFNANMFGISVGELSKYSATDGSMERAIWMGLLGLVTLAIGMRLGMWKLKETMAWKAQSEAAFFSPERAFVLYLMMAVISEVLGEMAWSFGGLAQQIQALLSLKWVFFFVLGYVVLSRRERYPYFFAAVLIEFIRGIGFFSGFKTVLFFTLIIIFTVRYRLRPGTIISSTFILAALLIFGAAWTSIKPEFREFLNQGTQAQSVVVTQGEQFEKLGELIGQLSAEDVMLGIEPLFQRIAYVDYFALAMDYVPAYHPHEEGQVWLSSIRHVFTPRVFFPDKPQLLSDSELTMRYTGLQLASDAQGTSISIGYMGESYVDFGPYGMFFPVLLLGLFWGFMYYFFMSRAKSTVLGYAFATALLISAYQFEMASIKLLGGVTMKFIVLALVLHFLQDRLSTWLQKRPEPVPRSVRHLADGAAPAPTP